MSTGSQGNEAMESMKKIIERIRYWGQLLLLPVYWFSFLFPRNRKIWLFGSTFGRRFADNPRYFYLYVNQSEECRDIRAIWISHNKEIVEFLQQNGYEAYYYHSWKGIWYCLRGKVYLFDNYSKDISFWLSGGATKGNMWHGVGNKKINYDNEHDKVRHPQNMWERFKYFPRRLSDEKPSHYILTTSPMMSEIFSRAFQIPMERVIEVGYPRNDILFRECEIQNLYLPVEQELQDELAEWKLQGKTIVGYMPTFRPSEQKFTEVMDLKEFNHFLQEHSMQFVCKLHPKSQCKQVFQEMDYSNITVVDSEVDVNSFLNQIDILVADYSSVYSDYLLLNRPVVPFFYDFEEYSRDTRDAYFDWDEYMPDRKVYTQDGLEQAIKNVLHQDEMLARRQEFREKIYTDISCSACERMSRCLRSEKHVVTKDRGLQVN